MPRRPRIVVSGYPHHITQRGVNKMQVFLDDGDRKFFLRLLRERASDLRITLLAYCLMPNHFHLLAVPHAARLSVGIHSITFKYAQYFNRKYDRTGHLWQSRYFSCPIDTNAYLEAAIAYVEHNPVRAHLAKQAGDWPWSSAANPLVPCRQKSCKQIGRRDTVPSDDLSEDNLRSVTATGRPFGGKNFILTLETITGRSLRPKQRGRPKKERPW